MEHQKIKISKLNEIDAEVSGWNHWKGKVRSKQEASLARCFLEPCAYAQVSKNSKPKQTIGSWVQMFKCCHTTQRMQSLPHRDVESPKVQIHPEFWVAQGLKRRNGMMCGGTNVWGANGRSMHHPTRTEKGTTKRAICLRIAAGGFKAGLTGWLCISKSLASLILIPSWHPLTVQALYGSFMHLYNSVSSVDPMTACTWGARRWRTNCDADWQARFVLVTSKKGSKHQVAHLARIQSGKHVAWYD